MMQARIHLSNGPLSGQVHLNLTPLESWWSRLQDLADRYREADGGGPRPGVARARCGCPCGAGPESVLSDGVHRYCTGCGETH